MFKNTESFIELITPEEFNFDECLAFLDRSDNECLHHIEDNSLYKLIKIKGEVILIKISFGGTLLKIEFPAEEPKDTVRPCITEYVQALFDIDRDLKPFYEIGKKDRILNKLIEKYYGLRIIAIPDLFEAITWAIIGQQINLTFAYSLKRRFVENFGENFIWNNNTYWLYPTPEAIAKLVVNDLTKLQFTRRKAEYVIGTAQNMTKGRLTKEGLWAKGSYDEMKKDLLSIRGIGKWTADYVLMKCLKQMAAFPVGDIGLQNALKSQLCLERKPTIDEIEKVALNWKEWEAYATFYLWRSLYN